jgi:plastocyanin
MRIKDSTTFVASAIVAIGAFGQMGVSRAQEPLDVTARLEAPLQGAKGASRSTTNHPPAVIWLAPVDGQPAPPLDTSRKFTLLQKNKEFTPHLLVVPVGSVVQFPNEDPFFHNVFSLFDGRRFDLGLYEAGSTREVTFGRVGVSYIFCNIHPEMSAVVIALSTPYFAAADSHGLFRVPGVPPGEYQLQVWVQGADVAELKALWHRVTVSATQTELGVIALSRPPHAPAPHTNKYGKPYDKKESTLY